MAEERQIILDIQANTGKLNTRLDDVTLELTQQSEALKELNKEYRKQLKNTDDVTAVQTKYAKSVNEIKKNQKALRTEQRGLIKQLELQKKVTESAEGSNERLRAQLALLTKEYNKLGKAERGAGTEGEKLQKTIKGISDELKRNEKAVGDNRRNVGNYESAFDGVLGKLGGLGSALLGPAGAIFAIESLGETLVEGGKALTEMEAKFTELRGTIQLTTGAIEEELDTLTAAYAATSEVFKIETEEINKAVIKLRDNFGTDLPRAIELVQNGLLGVANQGEFLSNIEVELSKLVGLGISDDSAIAFLVEATNRGVNPDIIAEPLIALREQTKPALEALEAAFGPTGAQDVIDTFANDPIKGIQAVSNRFAELPSTSREAGLLLADIFKAPGEDAIAYVSALGEMNFNLNELIDPSNALTQQQIEQLEVATDLAATQNEISKELEGLSAETGNLTKQIQTGLLKAFLFLIRTGKEVINFFIDLFNESAAFRGVIRGIVFSFQTGIEATKLFFNTVIDGFKNAGALLKAVFTGNFRAIPDLIKNAASELGGNFVEFGKNTAENFSDGFQATLTGRSSRLGEGLEKEFERIGEMSGKAFAVGTAAGITSQVKRVREAVGKISVLGFGDFGGVTSDQQARNKKLEAEKKSGQDILNASIENDRNLLSQAQKAANEQVNVSRQQTKDELEESKKRLAGLEEDQRRRRSIINQLGNAVSAGIDLVRNRTEEEIEAARERTAAEKVAGVAQASIDTYVAANRALASGLPMPANFIAMGIAIATGLANVRQILGFAQGGIIPNSAQNLQRPRSNGDNVLITARTGEAIVNRRQIATIGEHNFRRAGVPGFADGGIVGATNLATMASRQGAQAEMQGANLLTQLRNMPTPIVTVKDISKATNRVAVKQNTSRL